MSDVILDAANEIAEEMASVDHMSPEEIANIIRAKLSAAVPEKVDPIHPHSKNCRCDDCGWNECRKAFLGGE